MEVAKFSADLLELDCFMLEGCNIRSREGCAQLDKAVHKKASTSKDDNCSSKRGQGLIV